MVRYLRSNNKVVIDMLIRHGAEFNASDGLSMRTPLHYAALAVNIDSMQALLESPPINLTNTIDVHRD